MQKLSEPIFFIYFINELATHGLRSANHRLPLVPTPHLVNYHVRNGKNIAFVLVGVGNPYLLCDFHPFPVLGEWNFAWKVNIDHKWIFLFFHCAYHPGSHWKTWRNPFVYYLPPCTKLTDAHYFITASYVLWFSLIVFAAIHWGRSLDEKALV